MSDEEKNLVAASEENKEDEAKIEDPKTDETNGSEKMDNSYSQIIQEIDGAISNMIIPLGSAVRDCIIQQYNYIRHAYTLIKK